MARIAHLNPWAALAALLLLGAGPTAWAQTHNTPGEQDQLVRSLIRQQFAKVQPGGCGRDAFLASRKNDVTLRFWDQSHGLTMSTAAGNLRHHVHKMFGHWKDNKDELHARQTASCTLPGNVTLQQSRVGRYVRLFDSLHHPGKKTHRRLPRTKSRVDVVARRAGVVTVGGHPLTVTRVSSAVPGGKVELRESRGRRLQAVPGAYPASLNGFLRQFTVHRRVTFNVD